MRVTGPCENPHAQRAVRRERDSSFRHDRLGLSTCRAECTSSSASCNVWHVEDVRELSAIERRDEGCGARRALNAREWSGDATSGDATSGDATTSGDAKRGESEAQVRDFCSTRSAQLLPSTKCSRKAGVVLQAYRLTSFCEARLLLELRVLAYGLSLTDRPIAVPPRLNCPTRCNHQNRPSWRSRDKLTSVT